MTIGLSAKQALTALALGAVLTSCSGASSSGPASGRDGEASFRADCPVTRPRPPADAPFRDKSFNYGNESLGVVLWEKGTLVAGRLPSGLIRAEILPDGSIEAKLGWWRAVKGRLHIEGERIDASAPPVRAWIPEGYGDTGFQSTLLTFPTEGCWRIVGQVGDARLAFVVRVVKGHASTRRRSSAGR